MNFPESRCEMCGGWFINVTTHKRKAHSQRTEEGGGSMATTTYPNGYGRRDPVPHCVQPLQEIQCYCCKGDGEHSYGAGMDSDAVTCQVCQGYGYLLVRVPYRPKYDGDSEARSLADVAEEFGDGA